jgi:hypothetical protein
MLIHREALELAKLAHTEDEGHALNCLRFEEDGHVVVSDGHQFLRVNGKVDEPSLFDALIPEGELQCAAEVLLPSEAAQSFNAALKKRKKKKGEPTPHIVLSQDDGGVVRVASSDGKVTRRFDVKPVETPYPNIDAIRRQHISQRSVTLGVDLMIKILRAMKGAGCTSVTLDLAEGKHAPIRLKSFSDVMGPVEGAVMPMRLDDEKADAA